jgi:5-methylcytosine-specific restriction endonuclease McrA
MKICGVCKQEKSLLEFYKRKKGSIDGLMGTCKLCMGENSKKWHKENPEKVKQSLLKYKINNPEKLKELYKNYRLKNLEKVREKDRRCAKNRRKLFPEKTKESLRKWHLKNPTWGTEYRRAYHKKIRSTSRGKLNDNMSSRMYHFLKFRKNNTHWEKFVDYSLDQLIIHLEKQFKEGMDWDNYGSYWEVDHIIPIAVFNFKSSNNIDFKKCWNLKNLQPLEKKLNRIKKDILSKPFQPSLALSV